MPHTKERERWEIVDAVTLRAQGLLLKGGILWSLFHEPMVVF